MQDTDEGEDHLLGTMILLAFLLALAYVVLMLPAIDARSGPLDAGPDEYPAGTAKIPTPVPQVVPENAPGDRPLPVPPPRGLS